MEGKMRDIRLTEIAKQELVNEYGEKATIVDNELNQLAKSRIIFQFQLNAYSKLHNSFDRDHKIRQ